MSSSKILSAWVAYLFLGLLIFTFLHECGHGFGSSLDGIHVSTGFNRVGDVGKRPADPDFRANRIIQRGMNISHLSGPFINWTLVIFFTAFLLSRTSSNLMTLFFGAGAVSNALMRFIPLTRFFVNAALGNLVIEDEVSAGILAIKGLKLPMPFNEFRALTKTQPALFLSQPKIYIWPILSLTITTVCLALACHKLYRLHWPQLPSRFSRWLFALMPILVWPLIFACTNVLDNLIRINW